MIHTPAMVTRTSADSARAKSVGVERTQIVELLADPDQLHRNPEFARDRERDPALGGAIQLGQHQP